MGEKSVDTGIWLLSSIATVKAGRAAPDDPFTGSWRKTNWMGVPVLVTEPEPPRGESTTKVLVKATPPALGTTLTVICNGPLVTHGLAAAKFVPFQYQTWDTVAV